MDMKLVKANCYNCGACGRKYGKQYNLNKHLRGSEVCNKWIKMNLDKVVDKKVDGNLLKIVQNEYKDVENYKCFQDGKYKCLYCNKSFSTKSNLNKHKKRSVICKKWEDMKIKNIVSRVSLDADSFPKSYSQENVVGKYLNYANELTINLLNIKDIKDMEGKMEKFRNTDNIGDDIYDNRECFSAPKDKLVHVIWNLFLCDKYQKIDDIVIEDNKIGYILAILPKKDDYMKYIDPKLVEHYVFEYHDVHYSKIDKKMLELYDEQCEKIEIVRKKEYRNIIIYCNNGMQRSIPFICYYLLKYHPDEFNSLKNVLKMVLKKLGEDISNKKIERHSKRLAKLCDLFTQKNA